MQVAFLTNLTSQSNLDVLGQLSKSQQVQLVHIFFYDTLAEGRRSFWKTLKAFGWRRVALKVFRVFMSKAKRILGTLFPSLHGAPISCFEFAQRNSIPYSVVASMNIASEIEKFKRLNLDLLIVCVCKNILKPEVIATPVLGTINIHPSLLPKYRGPVPIFWALYYGESESGVSFQQMTKDIDLGSIIAQFSMPIDYALEEEQIEAELFSLAANKLDEVLALVREGKTHPENRSADIRGSYFSFPTERDRLEQKGRRRRAK